MQNINSFTVCMSVYRNDKPKDFCLAIKSIYHQTVVPNEIILVVDGLIPKELTGVILQLQVDIPILKVIHFEKNMGLGIARQKAVENAKNELIAVMDSDDVAMQYRFEKQLKCFKEDSSLSIVGGAITEFIGILDNVAAKRICPLDDKAIKQYMKSRCGFNHMTVMFKKADVLKAGNYQDWHYNEDYYLWLRMMQCGCKFCNLEDVLVNVRVGRDMYARRGGLKYFNSEYLLQKYMLKEHIISFPRFIFNVIVRLVIEVAMPNQLRAFVFQKLLRK